MHFMGGFKNNKNKHKLGFKKYTNEKFLANLPATHTEDNPKVFPFMMRRLTKNVQPHISNRKFNFVAYSIY